MSYTGYLVRIGGYTVPSDRFMRAESFSSVLNIQDLDSLRDGNGVLHRNALEHVPLKIEFETPALLTNAEFAEFMASIRENYTVPLERKASVTAYVPELDDYVTQDMYMSDPKPTIYGIFDDVIKYNPTRIAFIGY